MKKKGIGYFALALALMFGVLGLAGCGDKLGAVEGTVTDAATGELVPNARVVVYGLEKVEGMGNLDTFTKGLILQKQFVDEDGGYSLSLEKGTYVFQVWIEGMEVTDRMVEVKSGRTTTADFEVQVPSP